MRQVRIGIDVGGTFTDAVAIDNDTYEIIAKEKIPTTHDSKEGVAEGIVRVLQNIMEKNGILPKEVVFIAHGTTQATNALLEGDVAVTGILGMGCGIEAGRAKKISNIGNIPIALGKELKTVFTFLETSDAASDAKEVEAKIQELKAAGAEVIVATEAYGVDDPANEAFVVNTARSMGLYATGGHEVSKLYGLKVRTRTAVVNGSLIPRMMETANMTESCVKRAGITNPLMIMRCDGDGGVMTVDEVRRRPILTMLSGLAAGVAGVLMYEKLSDGIFLEAGGTSTDISVVKDGRVMVRYGEIGGHKTYLSSLDVRTLGVAGGSMIRVENGKITDVGPRSAHIAGLPYEVFSQKLEDPKAELIAPLQDDAPVFAVVRGADGRRVSLTLAGAANVLRSVPEGDYAYSAEIENVAGLRRQDRGKRGGSRQTGHGYCLGKNLGNRQPFNCRIQTFAGTVVSGRGRRQRRRRGSLFGKTEKCTVEDCKKCPHHFYNRSGHGYGSGSGGAYRGKSHGQRYEIHPSRSVRAGDEVRRQGSYRRNCH